MKIDEVIKKYNQILKESDDYSESKIEYILFNNKENKICVYAATEDILLEVNPNTSEVREVYDWTYSFDDDIFGELQDGHTIEYMTMDMHYNIWNFIEEFYPEDIEYKDGLNIYLKYCEKNNINKVTIDKEVGLDTPNIDFISKEKTRFDDKVIIESGFRKDQPVALIEKELGGNDKEYIIAFHYKVDDKGLSWGYSYYYSDKNSAIKDYEKVINGGNLADKKQQQER